MKEKILGIYLNIFVILSLQVGVFFCVGIFFIYSLFYKVCEEQIKVYYCSLVVEVSYSQFMEYVWDV